MTIAIGMLYRGGVLMCADTLVSSATRGEYQSKVQGYQFHDGEAVFALAGNVALSESAIQQCEPVLRSRKKVRSKEQIAAEIRSVLCREYKTHVLDNQLQYPDSEYSLVVAIRSGVDGIGLYCTQSSTMVRSKKGFECVGAGEDLGQVLLRQSYRQHVERLRAWNIAAYAIAMAKRFMPGSVGGEPVMLDLADDGYISASGYKDFQMVEKYAPHFDGYLGVLRLSFLDINSDDAYAEELDRFSREVTRLRSQWKGEMRGTWSNPPPAARDAIIDLRPAS